MPRHHLPGQEVESPQLALIVLDLVLLSPVLHFIGMTKINRYSRFRVCISLGF